jgi:NitT/TauT family transport system permease protein
MGLLPPVEWFFRPYVNASLSLPLVAIIPIILLIFGLSQTTIVVVIVLYVLPVVMVNTFAGVRSTDRDLLDMARSFNAGRGLVIRRIILPSSRALTLAGVRIGVGRAITGGIVAEQVIGVLGVGGVVSLALINRIEQRYQIKET